MDELVLRAAQAIASADALLIAAGAGMGVDSGLPDFRGDAGFWRAYPPYQKLGLNFVAVANPRWFATDPELAWGFYGHRLMLYRQTPPHHGFEILREWCRAKKHACFVFTSNVDGHFTHAGFDPERIVECHGSLDWLQCTRPCGIGLFPARGLQLTIDESSMRAVEPLPLCPSCGALARPNVLMFNDWGWDSCRADAQLERLDGWLRQIGLSRLTIIECGAGGAIPTVRRFSETLATSHDATLIRINPREPETPPGHIGIPRGALETLRDMEVVLCNG